MDRNRLEAGAHGLLASFPAEDRREKLQTRGGGGAKFGIVGLVHGLAKRYAREKIRVNAVCPGPTDTPMLRVFVARPDSQLPPGETPETLVVKRGGQVPMGRPAQPEEIANAALFLISDEASYITGVALPVDGGATA